MAVSNGMGLFKPLYWLFGKCMEGLLMLFNDQYFLALIVFTIITRLILLPFNLKQQKTMAKTSRLQPKFKKFKRSTQIQTTLKIARRCRRKCRSFTIVKVTIL